MRSGPALHVSGGNTPILGFPCFTGPEEPRSAGGLPNGHPALPLTCLGPGSRSLRLQTAVALSVCGERCHTLPFLVEQGHRSDKLETTTHHARGSRGGECDMIAVIFIVVGSGIQECERRPRCLRTCKVLFKIFLRLKNTQSPYILGFPSAQSAASPSTSHSLRQSIRRVLMAQPAPPVSLCPWVKPSWPPSSTNLTSTCWLRGSGLSLCRSLRVPWCPLPNM